MNDNPHPCIADVIEAIVRPPPVIRDMERDALARMRAEHAGAEDHVIQALESLRAGLSPAGKI